MDLDPTGLILVGSPIEQMVACFTRRNMVLNDVRSTSASPSQWLWIFQDLQYLLPNNQHCHLLGLVRCLPLGLVLARWQTIWSTHTDTSHHLGQ